MNKHTTHRDEREFVFVYESDFTFCNNFAKVDIAFIEFGRHLTDRAKCVYMTLKSYAGKEGNPVFPSLTTLARRSGYARPSISASIKELEEFGWIEKKQREDWDFDRRLSSNQYRFTTPKTRIDEHLVYYESPSREQAKLLKNRRAGKREKYRSATLLDAFMEDAQERAYMRDLIEEMGLK